MHRAARVQRGTPGDAEWLLLHLTERRTYRASPLLALALLAHGDDARAEAAREWLEERGLVGTRGWQRMRAALRDRDLLVESSADGEHPMISRYPQWEKAGWAAAADYVLATYDYPFVDYSDPLSAQEDGRRMRGYIAEEPDHD